MREETKTKSFYFSRRAAMSILIGVAILFCAFFTRIYTAMPWHESSILGIPDYQWRQSVAAGFFSASVCGILLSAGCIFWVLLTPLTGAGWAHDMRRIWLRLGESGMIAWIFLFCAVGSMWTVLFPWMAHINRLSPGFLWQWGGEPLALALKGKGMNNLAERVWFLNMPFFFTREFLYGFLLVLIPSVWMNRFERSREIESLHSRTQRVRRICSALLFPFVVIVIGMMGVDWTSPNGTEWIPSIFPLAFLSHATVLGLAMSCCFLPRVEQSGRTTSRMGGLLIAGLMFKLYFWYSMYMLVWYADIPGETSFYSIRLRGDWGGIASFCSWSEVVILLLLLIPFVRKKSGTLAGCGAVLLLFGMVEVYWMIAPGMGVDAPWGMCGWVFISSLLIIAFSMCLLFISRRKQDRSTYLDESP